jgi:hypothetical protein
LEPGNETVWREHREALHEEINRLPRSERTVIVLCDLEGLSLRQAAKQLHWRVVTVDVKRTKGRERLQAEMHQRGLTIPVTQVLAEFARLADRTASKRLIEATVAFATQRSAVENDPGDDSSAARIRLTAES